MKPQDWFRQKHKEISEAKAQEKNPCFSGTLLFDEPLSKHTYYRIGGPASVFAIPKSTEDLLFLAEGIEKTGIPFFILGQGSNVLVSDAGFQGLIVRVSRLNLEIGAHKASSSSNSMVLRTGASVAISSLLRKAAMEGWGGLEFLTGIPGSVGGAVFMNAGTHLGEAKGSLKSVDVYSLQKNDLFGGEHSKRFFGDELHFQYRKNLFLPKGGVVWAAEWEVQKKDPAQVKADIDQILSRRKATQPVEYPSCGSVFKNLKMSGLSAWQVIHKVRLKGHRIGDAQFAEKHCNFIINLGNARASDVKALINLAKERVLKELGEVLEEEVIYLG